MRIAVTGAGGGIGRAFLEEVSGEHDVVPLTHADLPVEDAAAVRAVLDPVRPDVVLHLAAKTSVDGCQEDPEGARRVNVEGTAHVAEAAARAGAVLVAMSTDYVFDGRKEAPYDERDRPNPRSVYGRTKLDSERAAAAAPDRLVVRTSWVFGAPGEFVREGIRRMGAGEEVGGIVDQVGTPTYVRHLAARLLPLVEAGLRGVVHLAGTEPATWHHVLDRARGLGDLPGTVAEQKVDELGRPAPRPAYSPLRSVVLPHPAVPPMPSLDDALRELLEEVRVGA